MGKKRTIIEEKEGTKIAVAKKLFEIMKQKL